jgi:hypothetical protein
MGRSSNNRFAIVIGISVIIITVITVYIIYLGNNNSNNFSVFAQGNSQANPMNGSSGGPLNAVANSLNFTSAAGTIASLQNDVNGKQSWVVSGTWHLLVFKPRFEQNKMVPATVTFDSIFDMVRLNGQAKHEHTMSVSDFNLTKVNNFVNSTDQVLTTIFNGTSKITMEGSSHNNVPTSIKIMDKGTISLWVDPSKINYHFGNTPIYGIISKQSG